MRDNTMRVQVLILDDEPAYGKLVGTIARKHGFHSEYIDVFPDPFDPDWMSRFHILVLDLSMPECDGIEVIRKLAETNTQVGLILISGVDPFVLTSAKQLVTDLGLTLLGALNKPFSINALKEVLGRYRPLLATQQVASREPFTLEDVQEGLANREFLAHYQPKFDVHSRKIVGAEALVRWQHPRLGLLAPGAFIDYLDHPALVKPFTDAVLNTALPTLAGWLSAGIATTVAINLSANYLNDPQIPDQLVRACEQYGVPHQALTFEITESAAVNSEPMALDILTRLRLKGFCCAIDDFGSGYASFRTLQKLPFNEIKIDNMFTGMIGRDQQAEAIIESTSMLSQRLGLKMVLEGIETEQQLQFAQQLGSLVGQGYLISPPIPAATFKQLLGVT